jgi:uncharacterized membrane protein YeaQ/YmgE (transglycosylase-associated protein family)
MGVVFLVVVGSILGWLAAIIMRTEHKRGILLNIAAGIGGALLTGFVIGPMLGLGHVLDGRHSIAGLLTALAGAVVLLLAVNLLRIRELR